MSWNLYLENLFRERTELDDLTFSIENGPEFCIPPIIKVSVLLTNELKKTSLNNIIMFPERSMSAYLYALTRTLHNLAENRRGQDYNPMKFQEGQLLKFKNHVVRFIDIIHDDNNEPRWIKIELADKLITQIQLAFAPHFQLTTTNRPLSSYKSFKKDHKVLEKSLLDGKTDNSFLTYLSNIKTHLGNTSIYVSPIMQTQFLVQNTKVNGQEAGKLLLFSQADHEGSIKPMTAGQADGIPALTIASDLYVAEKMVDDNYPVHSVLVQADQDIVDRQLDAIDSIIASKIPITLISDLYGIQETTNLKKRNFGFWVWNETSLSPFLLEEDSPVAFRVKNSIAKKIDYLKLECPLLSQTLQILNESRRNIETTAPNLIPVHDFLLRATFRSLRAITPITNIVEIQSSLERALYKLDEEKRFVSEELYSTLLGVIENVSTIYSGKFVLPKSQVVKELLSHAEQPLCIIVPDHTNKISLMEVLSRNAIDADDFQIYYPDEYIQNDEPSDGLTVVSGWFNKKTMQKIYQANITPEVLTLLYEIEDRWQSAFKTWEANHKREQAALNQVSLNSIGIEGTSSETVLPEDILPVASYEPDELETIELTMASSRYSAYKSTKGLESVDAIPVDYVGNVRAFLRIGRSIVTVTGMMYGTDDSIKETTPEKIKVGDFIVESSSSKDIVREIADHILENSGYKNLRDLASMWKETLMIMERLSGWEVTLHNLKAAGCIRHPSTIREWLVNEKRISPMNPKDILCIAKAAGDPVLREKFEEIVEAGKLVKQAHIRAGHHLSGRLKKVLKDTLSSVDFGYVRGIWEPIKLKLDEFGDIKILKVIDVGPVIQVDQSVVNRLLSPEQDVFYGVL